MKIKKTRKLQSLSLSYLCVLSIFCTCFLLTQGNPCIAYEGANHLGLSAQEDIMPDVEIVQIVIEKFKDIISVAAL